MATKQINLRIEESLLEAIDSERGLVPRNAWINAALESYWCDVLHKPVPKAAPRSEKPGVPERSPGPEFQITHGGKSTKARRIDEPAPMPYRPRRVDLTKPPLQRPIIQKRS